MKHFLSGMLIAFTLAAILVTGAFALAENAEPETPALPAIEETQPEQDAQQPAADAATDDAALLEAFDAYRAAKQASRLEALEAELKGYVESGKLTQEQMDLILNNYKERQSLRSGACPGCGNQFGNGGMGKGSRSMKGGRMNGNRGGFNGRGYGQQPTFG